MPSSPNGEVVACVGLCVVVGVWLLDEKNVERPVALGAFCVLCVRLLAAAARDLMALPMTKQQQQMLKGDIEERLAPAKRRRNRTCMPSDSVDATSVTYTPYANVPMPSGTKVPPAAQITVADRLDMALNVMDFIPLMYHAGILLNRQLGSGNVDVTKYVQAAIDFVGMCVPCATRTRDTSPATDIPMS
eukprot:SAG11_NODE_697_length_7684_cov_8.250231_5_plen_189_part_00